MGIRREDLVRGGYAYFRTRFVVGGAAARPKLERVKVLDWDGGAATLELEDGTKRLTPFHQMEPDEAWLEAHRAQGAQQVEAEATKPKPAEALPPPAPEPEPAPESMPPEERVVADNLLSALGAVDVSNERFDFESSEGRRAALEHAKAEIAKGRAFVQVARELGADREALKKWLARDARGEPLEGVGRGSTRKLPPGRLTWVMSNEEAEVAARAIINHEVSWDGAAKKYKASASVLLRIVQHFRAKWAAEGGVSAPEPEPEPEPEPAPPDADDVVDPQPEEEEPDAMPAPTHQMYTPAQRAELAKKYAAMLAKGVHAKAAAKKLGVTETALREWKLRAEAGELLAPRKRRDFTKAEQIRIALYLELDKKSAREAEVRFGCRAPMAAKYARAFRMGVYGEPKKLIAAYRASRQTADRFAEEPAEAPAPRATIQASPPPPPKQAEMWAEPAPSYVPPPQPYQPPIDLPPEPQPEPVRVPHYPQLPPPPAPPPVNGHSGLQVVVAALQRERDELRASLDRAHAEVAKLRAQNKAFLAALSHE